MWNRRQPVLSALSFSLLIFLRNWSRSAMETMGSQPLPSEKPHTAPTGPPQIHPLPVHLRNPWPLWWVECSASLSQA